MQRITLLLSFFALLFVMACADKDPVILAPEPELPTQLVNYANPDVAGSFWIDESRYNVSDEGATLGRVLFYDKILSKTNRVSCGSCHAQAAGFADPVPFSEGVNGDLLSRHTPSIANAYDDPFLFWDGRSENLHDLALRPVRNHKEMGIDDTDFIIAKVEKAPYYDDLFTAAYGDAEVTEQRIADALSQFIASMISGRNKWDMVNAGEAQFTELEMMGQNVFFGEGRCYTCHNGQDFNQRGFFGGPFGDEWSSTANIGLDEVYTDNGAGELDPERAGEFKIPSLRNIAVTAPYMHDGRFATLEDVIDHYNNNIADHPNLALELRDWETDGAIKLGLDGIQVQALAAFLRTLTDEQYLEDPKFSDPFE
jgi:cytochrome c peroxidase